MSKLRIRLLAAGATLLSLATTAPSAQAADPLEATAAPYVFWGGQIQEGATVEADTAGERNTFRQPHLIVGRTEAHPGWDLRLADEAVGATLPTQDTRADAWAQDATGRLAGTSGFISLIDQDASGLPFLVFGQGSRSVGCSTDGPPWAGGGGRSRLFVRQNDQLVEVDQLVKQEIADVTPGDRENDGLHRVTFAEVRPVNSVDVLTPYAQFEKYAARTKTGAVGYEIVISQVYDPYLPPTVYRVLVGASAVSC